MVSPRNDVMTPLLQKHGYEWLYQLGQGKFGRVHVVQVSNTRRVAKMVALDELPDKEQKLAQQESELLKRLQHPHIVEYHESWVDMQGGSQVLVLVMELCEGGDLKTIISNHAKRSEQIDESSIWRWFLQLVKGLQYIHKENVLHRDLKSSNIFITGPFGQELLKIGDFGISRVLQGTAEAAITVVGTPYYLSPEVCRSEAYREKSDMWSLGCVLYELCVLRHAFESQSLLGLIYRIISENYQPIPPCYSEAIERMTAWLLAKSPDDRPTADDVLAALSADGPHGQTPPRPRPTAGQRHTVEQKSLDLRQSPPRCSPQDELRQSPSRCSLQDIFAGGTRIGDFSAKKLCQPPYPPQPPLATPPLGSRLVNLGRTSDMKGPIPPGKVRDVEIEDALLQHPPALFRPAPPSLIRPAPPSKGCSAPSRSLPPPPPAQSEVNGLRNIVLPPRPPAGPVVGDNQRIDSETLIAHVREALVRRPRAKGNWVQAFALCDREGKGVLDVQDFVAFLGNLDLGLGSRESMAVADYLKTGSGTGCVTLGDFHKALCAN